MATIKSILGKLFVNDKQIVVLDDTAENGGIEEGSNANGRYVKFPEGTLVQYGTTEAHNVSKDFPIPFIAIPSISLTMEGVVTDNVYISNILALSTTALTVSKHFHLKTSASVVWGISGQGCRYIAIGRWK